MRTLFLLLLLLCCSPLFAQRNLSSSRMGSVYTYVYKLTPKEAKALYRTEMENVSESYLHSLVDSFEKGTPSLQPGNYLFVKAEGNRLKFDLQAVGDVNYKLINNNRDLVVVLHKKDGTFIHDAAVSINGKSLRYDAATQTFRKEKHRKEGMLQVYFQQTLYVFLLEKNRMWQPSLLRRIGQAAPLKFVLNPLRKLLVRNSRRYENFYRSTPHEQNFRGFMVFNKPKYKPGDTVQLKAFVTTKGGKPLKEKLLLRLSDQGFNTDSIIAEVAPYRNGGYVYSFVLSDSLDLDLDREYLLTLEEESSRKYNLSGYDGDLSENESAAKRKVVMRGRFYHEEYELGSIRFSARSSKERHGRGEEVALYLKASDENDMAVMDGRVKLIAKTKEYGTKAFSAPTVFLPDTLWQHEQPLEALGETKVILPDSLFPGASFSYEVECIFLNTNNERQIRSISQTFYNKTERILFEQREDSLAIEYLVQGKAQPATGMLYGFNEKGDTLTQKNTSLPLTISVHPFVRSYKVVVKNESESFVLKTSPKTVSALASRTRDSVFIQLVNPQHLPVWYTVFAGNKVILRGYGDHLLFAAKTTTPKNYFVSLQYIFNDRVFSDDFTIPYRDKLLSIKVTQPDAVYPGQTATIGIAVSDAAQQPVAQADVTAWAFTKKFTSAQTPFVPYLGKLYPGRKQYALFSAGEEAEFQQSTRLAWERWSREMHLDTMEYYKFLRPDSLYVNTEPVADSVTQIAPFVVLNGELQPVHQLYIDEVPVFFKAAQHLQRYSFAVTPGKHSFRLRTHNRIIILDSFSVAKGVKTFLSINADGGNHRIRQQKVLDTLSTYEKNLWSKYMLLMENTFGENYAYVNSGNRVFLLRPNSYVRSPLIGPLPNQYAELVVKNKFRQPFEAEANYHYFISKGLVKQKQLKDPYPFSSRLSAAVPPYDFRDYVLTEKEVDSLWQEYLYNRSAREDLFTNPFLSQRGNGALHIAFGREKGKEEIFIRNIFLFQYNDPDFLRIYRGNTRNLGFLQPGKYRLLFLLKGDNYFIRDSVSIRKNGINYYEIHADNIKQKDSVSTRISAIVNDKEKGWSHYQGDDFNSIKESFNQQYFDASLLTETVSGIVRDEQGVPVAGATVFIKGTRTGTTTNPSGEFLLRTLPNSTLVVSSVGYTSQEIKVKDAASYSLVLMPAKHSLSEVVVVGYGTSKRKDMTGAISSVVTNGLAGAAPGVLIRGSNTLSGKSPLVIVDGVPFSGKMEDLDPAQINQTTVLKAEQATAIYGARGENGVIIITTKGTKRVEQALTADNPLSATGTLRRNFNDYAYWQPQLRTDGEGKASFTVTYPDDITAWRTFALAITGNRQSGYAEGVVRSFKAISGNLSLPQFAIAGDTLTTIGKSLNYLMDSIEAKRSFHVNDGLVKENLLRFRNSWIDTFFVTAGAVDSLKLKYTLQKENGYFDGEERSIPVFRPGVLETTGVFAALRKDTAFTLQPLSDTGMIKIYAEASVLPSLQKEVESLRHYEYLCNEQLASKLKGLLVQKRIDSFLKQPFRYDKQVREIISKLSQSKAAAGLWGWWRENEPTLWISLHVTEALVKASAQGYAVPLNKTLLTDYLIYQLESYRGTEKLSALHLLHLLGAKADFKRYTDSLQMQLPKMSLYEKLRLAEIKQKAGLEFSIDTLLTKQNATLFGNVYWGEEGYRFFDNSIQNTLAMYRILKAAGGQNELLEKARGYFLEKRRSGHWRNTYESSLILEAILPDVLVNDALPKSATLYLSGESEQTINRFPFTMEVKSSQSLSIRKEGGLPLYFTAYQQRWNAAPKKVSGDFTINTTFSKNGSTTTRLKAGEPVQMKIVVSVKGDANYVMIEAPIPAGCSYKEKLQSYGNGEVHREYFKNKVSIFCSSLKKGEYTFTVSLLPRYAGSYTLNPAKAELMYFPVFYGREELKKVVVE